MFIYLKLSVMLYFSLPNPPSPLYTVMSYTVERGGGLSHCHVIPTCYAAWVIFPTGWYPAVCVSDGLEWSPTHSVLILLFVCLMAWNDPPHIQFWCWISFLADTSFLSTLLSLGGCALVSSRVDSALWLMYLRLEGSVDTCCAHSTGLFYSFIFVEEQTCFGLL